MQMHVNKIINKHEMIIGEENDLQYLHWMHKLMTITWK